MFALMIGLFTSPVHAGDQLLRELDHFQALNAPLLVGVSRKSMIYKTLDGQPETALNGTTALHAWALERGAHMLRVHDVAEAREVVALHRALRTRTTHLPQFA